ncbi:MAG: hypothetical protein RL033_6576, partial [Pseudomonadota bacterium]
MMRRVVPVRAALASCALGLTLSACSG